MFPLFALRPAMLPKLLCLQFGRVRRLEPWAGWKSIRREPTSGGTWHLLIQQAQPPVPNTSGRLTYCRAPGTMTNHVAGRMVSPKLSGNLSGPLNPHLVGRRSSRHQMANAPCVCRTGNRLLERNVFCPAKRNNRGLTKSGFQFGIQLPDRADNHFPDAWSSRCS